MTPEQIDAGPVKTTVVVPAAVVSVPTVACPITPLLMEVHLRGSKADFQKIKEHLPVCPSCRIEAYRINHLPKESLPKRLAKDFVIGSLFMFGVHRLLGGNRHLHREVYKHLL